MTEAEGRKVIKMCIEEVKLRFSLGRLDKFTIKVVDKVGAFFYVRFTING